MVPVQCTCICITPYSSADTNPHPQGSNPLPPQAWAPHPRLNRQFLSHCFGWTSRRGPHYLFFHRFPTSSHPHNTKYSKCIILCSLSSSNDPQMQVDRCSRFNRRRGCDRRRACDDRNKIYVDLMTGGLTNC